MDGRMEGINGREGRAGRVERKGWLDERKVGKGRIPSLFAQTSPSTREAYQHNDRRKEGGREGRKKWERTDRR
jgi:hypothetical protein